jgi:peptidyl-prolyl cis-trans isomerase-like 4
LDDPFDDPPQLAELIPENSPTGKPSDEVIEHPNHVHFSNKRG